MPENRVTIIDRLVSGSTYLTGGFVGFIWLIGCAILKKETSRFLLFNIYQAICLSLFIYVIYRLFVVIHDLLILVPGVRILVNSLWLFLYSPILYNRSIVGLIVFIIYLYLMFVSLFGKIPYFPWISKIILYQLDRFK